MERARAWFAVCVALCFVGLAFSLASFAAAQANSPGAETGMGSTEAAAPTTTTATTVPLYLFWGDGCPHCATEKAFLAKLQERYPALEVRAFEVYADPVGRALLLAMAEAFGREASGVPMTFLGDYAWVGFGSATGEQITAVVQDGLRYQLPDAADRLSPENRGVLEEHLAKTSGEVADTPDAGTAGEGAPESAQVVPTEGTNGSSPMTVDPQATEAAAAEPPAPGAPLPPASTQLHLPLIGVVDVASGSLFVGTLLIALADGFNPCSLWVLALLLAVVINTRSRRRVLLVGLVFLTVAAVAYAAFIAGLYTVFAFVGFLTWVRVAVAVIALSFAVINLKDYFAYKRGVSLTIDDDAKPGIFRGIRNVMSARSSVPATVLATGGLALGVTLVELPCTAGLPVLWTNLVADAGVGRGTFAMLLLVYMLVFLVDELLVFGVAVATMRAARVEEREGRVLKLFGGAVMLALALTMLLRPALLDTVSGMLWVFGAALAFAVLVLVAHRLLHPASSPLVRRSPHEAVTSK
ncbi:MAG: thioredoxin family protein [Trueperaceae bacterium]